MRHFSPLLLATALLFWAGGCVRCTQPVLLDEQVISEPDIVGDWTGADGKNNVVITKAAGDDDKSYAATYTDEHKKQGKFTVRMGKIDAMLIAEILPVDPAPDASEAYKAQLLPLYSFVFVEKAAGGKMNIRLLNPDWLGKYLDAHPDELKLAPVGKNDDKVVTSSTAEIQKFLRDHMKDEGALGDPEEMHKTDEKK